MTDSEAVKQAIEALSYWGVTDCPPRLINNRENAVFEVRAPDGARAALRLHRPGYQSNDSILSELQFMDQLRQNGFMTPQPIATWSGELITPTNAFGRVASLLSWVEGVPLGETHVPFTWTTAKQKSLHFNLGRQIARMHNLTDQMVWQKSFTRPFWDIEGLLGENPFWGRFWENPGLTLSERDLILSAREKAKSELGQFKENSGDFGLIHADLVRENILVNGDDLSIIDFDDCGFGFRLYDIAVALFRSQDEPLIQDLTQLLRKGYQHERPLAENHWNLLPMFLMLRSFALLGWIIPRMNEGEGAERNTAFVRLAVAYASEFLSRSRAPTR